MFVMSISSASVTQVINQTDFALKIDASDAMCRFDAPHHRKAESPKPDAPVAVDIAIEWDPKTVRSAHADDLVEFLQRWSDELDSRSARLHADMATHERRERAFRLCMQNQRLELESQLAETQQAQSRAEAAARRFAISNPS